MHILNILNIHLKQIQTERFENVIKLNKAQIDSAGTKLRNVRALTKGMLTTY